MAGCAQKGHRPDGLVRRAPEGQVVFRLGERTIQVRLDS